MKGGWNEEVKVTADSTLFSIQFVDHAVTVQDDEGNNVTVTLNGTVYFAYNINIDYLQNQVTLELIAYGSDITSAVGDESPESYPVDIYFSVTVSATETGTTATGTIQGNVGNTQISTSFSVTTPQIT